MLIIHDPQKKDEEDDVFKRKNKTERKEKLRAGEKSAEKKIIQEENSGN